jgi:hypothetical protein
MTRPALALLALAAALPASAREVAGVKLDDTVEVAGQPLRLNGAGIRKRFVVKVYVGALYLAAPSSDAEAIVAADAPKRVRMVFLRDVDRKSILDTFREGFANNSPGQAKELAAQLASIEGAIPDMKEGKDLVVTYVPGQGTTVAAAGGAGTTVAGKGFSDGLFRNWLGPKPADGDLKKALLGR